jgi:DNA-binding transcriptional regulator YdaS (Cro superfamily)
MKLLEYAKKEKSRGAITNLNAVWGSLASKLEVHPSLLKMWAYEIRKVSPRYTIPLEKVTDGMVRRSDSRPDLYPVEEY